MSQAESKRSRKIMDALRIEGAFCFKIWGNNHMMVGLPDIVGCYKGKFFGLEVKEPDKRSNTSTRQRYVMHKIQQAGGISCVVVDAREALEALDIALDD